MNPVAAARRRLAAWWLARLPRTDSLVLTQGNIYIVPSKAGLVFAATVVVMLLASINYQLSLGYVLTFLLAGSGLTSVHLTHRTLRGLQLHLRPPAPVFAGEPAALEVVIQSAGRRGHGIALALRDDERGTVPHGRRAWAWTDVPAQGEARVQLALVPPRRGVHALPPLVAETLYPFGLFRAWTVWRPAATLLAYPAPERPPAPLPPAEARGDAPGAVPADGGEFDGVRSYRRGDPLRQVVWKKAARTGELASRDSRSSPQPPLWLDWQATAGADAESRLSRLAAWVLAADARGTPHGLRLPGVELPPAQGETQRRRSLEALARWG